MERKSCNRRFVPQNLRYRASGLEVRTPHFRVISNAPEKEAQPAALKFERMRSVFARVFPDRNIDTAEFGLANAFFAGKDIPKDESKGAVLLERAARDSLPEAQFQMAERAYGTGSNPETYVAAYVWYALAQRSGYPIFRSWVRLNWLSALESVEAIERSSPQTSPYRNVCSSISLLSFCAVRRGAGWLGNSNRSFSMSSLVSEEGCV